jgi:hypothetical protein
MRYTGAPNVFAVIWNGSVSLMYGTIASNNSKLLQS